MPLKVNRLSRCSLSVIDIGEVSVPKSQLSTSKLRFLWAVGGNNAGLKRDSQAIAAKKVKRMSSFRRGLRESPQPNRQQQNPFYATGAYHIRDEDKI